MLKFPKPKKIHHDFLCPSCGSRTDGWYRKIVLSMICPVCGQTVVPRSIKECDPVTKRWVDPRREAKCQEGG